MIAPPSPALSLLGAAHFRLALGCRPNTGIHDCIFERTPRRRRDPQPYMLSATKIASPVLYINSYIHRILAIPSVDSGRVEDVASRMILQDRPNKLSNTFLHIRQRIEQAGKIGREACRERNRQYV